MLKDTDPMPWGKHKGTPMQNHWNPVARYIRENLSAYEKEHPDGIWREL